LLDSHFRRIDVPDIGVARSDIDLALDVAMKPLREQYARERVQEDGVRKQHQGRDVPGLERPAGVDAQVIEREEPVHAPELKIEHDFSFDR
jgi:hypothetical protein